MSLTGNNILAGASGQTTGYDIEQSLRFDDGDSAYLTRTPSSAGNRKTWTWSGWVKRGNLSARQRIFIAKNGSPHPSNQIVFENTDQLWVFHYTSSYDYQLLTTQLFRDVGSWYHLVVAVDTTQATSTDRIKIYVNGEQVTAFSTSNYPTENYEGQINNNCVHGFGNNALGDYFDGYLAEVYFIDGTALDASSFGETNADTNQWVPIKYTGSYGTNGFYLKFQDSSSLGDDSSGNTNDFTPTNLAATDQVLDSPTNNFATLNPLWERLSSYASNGSLSEGNLKFSSTSDYLKAGTFVIPDSNKWYWESYLTDTTSPIIGVRSENWFESLSGGAYVWYYVRDGLPSEWAKVVKDGTNVISPSDLSAPYVLGISFDASTGDIEFFRNGSSIGSTTVADTTVKYIPFVGHTSSSSSSVFTMNFGQDSSFAGQVSQGTYSDSNGIGEFAYQPPANHLALCSDNLPDSSIADPTAHFNTVLYTGNGSTQSITGVGHQPDFLWFKNRNGTQVHQLFDSVRGIDKSLRSNATDAENTDSPNDRLTSLDSDGFSLGADGNPNGSGNTYVAWNWKAGGTASSNTDGSTTSSVSANTDAGFSIVTCTTSAGTQSVGHGLSQAPDLVIQKTRSSAHGWYVYYDFVDGSQDYLRLDTTDAAAAWGGSAATSSVFYENWGSGFDLVCYCFHSVDGYSKVGSYTGNGASGAPNSDGPFVYTNFRPEFVLIKSSSVSGTGWHMLDAKRDPYNYAHHDISAQSSGAEYVNTSGSYRAIDFLSNGFKIRVAAADLNSSSGTYIYLAFAESPFKYSNAR